MKDNLLELLFDLFEKGLNQLKKYHSDNVDSTKNESAVVDIPVSHPMTEKTNFSTRIISTSEQVKLSKASYQFLVRMKLLGILPAESFEHIMNLLQFSDSRIVTVDETRWAIRKVLGEYLDKGQQDFLDLVLNHKNQAQTLH